MQQLAMTAVSVAGLQALLPLKLRDSETFGSKCFWFKEC